MDACLFSLTAQKLNEAAKGFPADSSEVIKWLEGEFRALQHRLEDDPGMEVKHRRLRKCVRDLRGVAQETYDVVENYHGNIIQLPKHGLKKWCRARLKVSRALRGIKEIMEEILSDMESIEEKEKTVVGFDEQVNELVEWLTTRGSSRSKGILGQPGAGKTTLLKKVYNHASVKSCFEDERFWVGHSSSRAEESLLRNLARKVASDGYLPEQVQSRTTMADEERVLHEMISNRLKGKRYLIVLDMNINNVIYEWERIKAWFPDEKNGSRILLSCSDHVERREELISSGSEVVEVLEIISLSQDDVWKLFENTFDYYREAAAAVESAGTGTGSSTGTVPLLEPFVRDYCRRLPSEIVNLGAILSMIYERRREFSHVAAFLETYRGDQDAAGSSGINISEIASRLNQLQGVQKLCFLYLGLFPQGLEIPARRLVQLWVAEGWIKDDGGQDVNDYLIDLAICKKMILEFRRSTSTINNNNPISRLNVTACDRILWEYSVMKSWQLRLYKISQEYYDYDSSGDHIRRLSLHSCGIYGLINSVASFPNNLLRSLTCFSQMTVMGGKATSFRFPSLIRRFKLLTVLDLEDVYFITQLPEDIGHQVTELRYLGLRRTGLERLPSSLGSFKNLQTLDIKHTPIRGVPSAIRNLKQLQYLFMDMNDAGVVGIPIDLSSLNHLRVLSVILAGEWMADGLGKLTNLRKLGIYGDLELCKDGLHHHLPQMRSLKSLRLGFGDGEIDVQKILSSLNSINSALLHSLYLERPLQELPGVDNFPKCSLTCLCLKWSQLHQDPMPTLGELPCLKVLKLLCASYLGERMVCPAGGFPMLNVLELNMLEGLEEWIVEERAMQELNRLVVHLCKRLEELPERLQDLRKLEELDVAGMPLQFSARLLHRIESDHHQWNLIFQHNTGKDWSKIVTQDEVDWSEIVNVTQGRPATWIAALKLFYGIEENMGKDWRKIQHIRSIIIDGIQMDATSSPPHQP